MATKFDYTKLQATATRLIERFGMPVTIAHLDGTQSRGSIVLPTHVTTDASIPDVGTVNSTTVTGFIDNVRNEVCVGDKVTANSKTWRVRESTAYRGATITEAYKVLLDR